MVELLQLSLLMFKGMNVVHQHKWLVFLLSDCFYYTELDLVRDIFEKIDDRGIHIVLNKFFQRIR